MNANGKTNIWNAAKAVIQGNFMTRNAYISREGITQISNPNLKKKHKLNQKLAEKKFRA